MYEGVRETNLSATVRAGTVVTASATPHAVGAWTELVASTAAAAQGFFLRVLSVSANAADTSALLDVAYGDVGGGNEALLAESLPVGQAEARSFDTSMGKVFFVPAVIPSGKSVSVRLRAAVVSDTAVVAIALRESAVHLADVSAATPYGAVTASSRGTLVPDASGAFGAWTEIGTTSADHNLFFPSLDTGGDTTVTTGDLLVQIGFGASAPGAGGTAIEALWAFSQSSSEALSGPFPQAPIYAVVASGTKLWARIAGISTENRGVTIHGMLGTVVTPGGGGATTLLGGALVR